MQGKSLYFIVAASLTLQGCSDEPKDEWLVGSWAPLTEGCQSGAGMTLQATGEYFEEAAEGIWQLNGSTLTITITARYDDDMFESSPVNETIEMQLTEHDQNTFTSDPPTLNWMRCSSGDAEAVASNVDSPAEPDQGNNGGGLIDNFTSDPNIYIACAVNGGTTEELRITPLENGQGMISAYSAASNAYIPNTTISQLPPDEGASVQLNDELIVINITFSAGLASGEAEYRVNRLTGAFNLRMQNIGGITNSAGQCHSSENMVLTERQF